MTGQALRGHALMLLATIAGILGFGVVYDGISAGQLSVVTFGIPLLFVGLWWAGRELGRSMDAARANRERRSAPQ